MPESDSPVFSSDAFSDSSRVANSCSLNNLDKTFSEIVNGVLAPIFLIIVSSLCCANLFNVNPANSSVSSYAHYFLIYLAPFVNLYFIAKKANTRPSIAMLSALGLSVGISAVFTEMFAQLIILFCQSTLQSVTSYALSAGDYLTAFVFPLFIVCTVFLLWHSSRNSISKAGVYSAGIAVSLWVLNATRMIYLMGFFSTIFLALFYALMLFLALRFILIPYYCLEYSWRQFRKQITFWAEDKRAAIRFASICVLLGIASSFIVDSPIEITRLCARRIAKSSSESSRAAVRLLQFFGDNNFLLNACNDSYVPKLDMGSLVLHDDGRVESAQKTYYRLTGKRVLDDHPSIDQKLDQALQGMGRRFDRVDDLLAEQDINGRFPGLRLQRSHISQVCSRQLPVYISNWELTFQSDEFRAREARAVIKLPAQSSLESAKIWMNGKPVAVRIQEKSIAVEAYRKTVLRKRDPLLITTAGPDKLFMQCFPVTSQAMKVELRIVSPRLSETETALPVPEIVDSNFFLPEKTTVASSAGISNVHAPTVLNAQAAIKHLYIVLDGSAHMKPYLSKLKKALWEAPRNTETTLLLASDQVSDLSPLRGTPKSQDFYRELDELSDNYFQGGPDNFPFLLRTWSQAKIEPGSALLWIHGPQPYLYGNEKPADIAVSFGRENPNQTRFIDCEYLPGPNKICQALEDGYWTGGRIKIEELAPGNELTDLSKFIADRKTREYDLRSSLKSSKSLASEDERAANLLLAKMDVDDLLDRGNVSQALSLSANNSLLSPVVGAIAIEPAPSFSAFAPGRTSLPYEAGLDGTVKTFLAHELDYIFAAISRQLNSLNTTTNSLNGGGSIGGAAAFKASTGSSPNTSVSATEAESLSLSSRNGNHLAMPEALGGCIGVVLHALVLALAATLLWLSCRRIIAKNIRIERASACVVMFVALMLAVYSVQIRDLLLLYLC